MADHQPAQATSAEPLLTPRQVRLLGYLILVAAGAWLLLRLRSVFPLFILGFLLAYVFDPVLDRLQARGWSRSGAIFLVFGGLMICLAIVAVLIVPTVAEQISTLVVSFDDNLAKLGQVTAWAEGYLSRLGASEEVLDTVRNGWGKLAEYGAKLAPRAGAWVAGSVSSLLLLLILPLITFYFMHEIDPIRARLRLLLPADYAEDILALSGDINRMLGRYIRGQATVCVLVGVATTLVLLLYSLIFKMGYALSLGLLAGATYIIPFIGATVTAVAAAVVGYVTTNSWVCAIVVLATMLAVNQVFDSVVSPKIVGESVGLHPLTVIFALMAGGSLSGFLGMIVAVPAAASLKVLLVHLFPKLQEDLQEELPPEDSASAEGTAAPKEVPNGRTPPDDPPATLGGQQAPEELPAASPESHADTADGATV